MPSTANTSSSSPSPMPPPPSSSSAGGEAGIGDGDTTLSSILRSPSPQQPPPINNYFQSHSNDNFGVGSIGISGNISNNGNGSNNNGGNGIINVDNIFASMTEESSAENDGANINLTSAPSNNHGNVNSSNSIFHNFSSMNTSTNNNTGGLVPPASMAPVRKYSADSNNTGSQSKLIVANNNLNNRNHHGNKNNGNNNGGHASPTSPLNRSGSDILSKSVGVTSSFLKNRNMSESESDPAITIRHAGYLLKRSNFPYHATTTAMPPSNVIAPSYTAVTNNNVESIAAGIAPLPDLNTISMEEDGDHHHDGNGVYSLPFGGLDDHHGDTPDIFSLNQILDTATATTSSTAASPSKGDTMVQPRNDPSPKTTEEENIETIDETCFCAPIVDLFDRLFHRGKRKDALVANGNGNMNIRSSPTKATAGIPSPTKKVSPSKSMPISPKPSRPLPINSPAGMNNYTMPLKPPARSEPMPISSKVTPKRPAIERSGSDIGASGRRMSSNQISRSFANGGTAKITPSTAATMGTTSSSSTAAIPTPKKQYPPPPPDVIDPKDGHIWRSKYCILEEGILYFYRTAEEGESEEAANERYESRMYAEEREDIVLGEDWGMSPGGAGRAVSGALSPGSAAGRTGSRRMSEERRSMSMEDRNSSQKLSSREMYDLSKSPMPMKKSYLLDFAKSPFHRSGSSVLTNMSSDLSDRRPSFNATLKHSESVGTFHQDADILWEKRVALDCVGAVRSSEQEHGSHAFELLAYGSSDDRDSDDDASRSTPGRGSGPKHEIIDRLILRAGSSDDMNAWMFEFHRSLTSFVQQIVNSVRSNDSPAHREHLFTMMGMHGGMHHAHNMGRPDSPMHYSMGSVGVGGQQHRRLPSGGASLANVPLSPFVAKGQSFASSPTAGGETGIHGGIIHNSSSFGGGGGYVGSLSHGHGRNALYRRQVRDGIKARSGSYDTSSVISPLHTPTGTPAGGSPVLLDATAIKKEVPTPASMMPAIIQSDASKIKNRVELPSLRDLREGKGQEEAISSISGAVLGTPSSPAASPPSVKPLSKGKYVPPHMRAGKGKYVPPHLRKKLAATAAGESKIDSSSTSTVLATKKPPIKPPREKEIPLNDSPSKELTAKDRAKTSSIEDDEANLSDSALSDSAFSMTSTSSLLSRQLSEEDALSAAGNYVRLGGCADPTVVVGSITDHHYIDRKASVVGNARLEAFGGTGGGFFECAGRRGRRRRSSNDGGEPMSFDDFDMDLPVSRRSSDNSSDLDNIKSVLKWEVGASSECGVRNSNEDSYVVINDLEELILGQKGMTSFSQQELPSEKVRQQGLYAIFDGHVGNQAARFSAEKFPKILMEEQSTLASLDLASLGTTIEERADSVLRSSFDRLDREFCRLCTEGGRDWDCGSTALVALIVDDVVSLANLGDCRGVVCRSVSKDYEHDAAETENDGWEALDPDHEHTVDHVWDRANGGGDNSDHDLPTSSSRRFLWKEITETHSPIFDEERERIEAANGWIIRETEIPIGQLHRMDIFDEDVVEIVKRCFKDRMKQHRSDPVRQIQIARTCGDLAVSRAIGDRDFKAAYNGGGNASGGGGRTNEDALARSWEGPLVFIYPEGHSGRFRGDIVSSVPDIKTFRVGRAGVLDEFLLMACDGLWDVMDGDDAVRIAKDLLFKKGLSARDGAARLAELAQHLGSSDNITVILIRFYWEERRD